MLLPRIQLVKPWACNLKLVGLPLVVESYLRKMVREFNSPQVHKFLLIDKLVKKRYTFVNS